jgi:UDP-GlcNAc:undecaprenyl-phosphate GlcNAc-1-phosphate transferase
MVTLPLTLLWYVGIINAFNLIDGLDGLASGLAMIASLGMIGVTFYMDCDFHGLHPIMLPILIGAVPGFFKYNYHPASIFMGDSGSLFIGFSLATFVLLLERADAFLVSFGLPISCLGVPMIDVFLAILRRTLRYMLYRKEGKKEGVMTADRDHVHDLALEREQKLVYDRGMYRLGVRYGEADIRKLVGIVSRLHA